MLRKVKNKGVAPLIGVLIVAAVIGTLLGGLVGKPILREMANVMFGGMLSVVNLIAQGFLTFGANFYQLSVEVGGKIKPSEFEGTIGKVHTMIQSVAYMVIALGFVICGIATALRIAEYEAKRTLVPLILVAILVSASKPLFFKIWEVSNELTGRILDAAPEAMNPAIATRNVWNGLIGRSSLDFVVKGGACIFMNIFAGSVYFLYGLLFLMRWAAIPILIAFSPLALACIPIGFLRPIWNRWLDQFIGWCLVGILGAMAIYMSNTFMREDIGGVKEILEASDPIFAPFKYLLPIGALLVGLFLSGAGTLVGVTAISSGIMAVSTGVMSAVVGKMPGYGKEIKPEAEKGGAPPSPPSPPPPARGGGAGAAAGALGAVMAVGKAIIGGAVKFLASETTQELAQSAVEEVGKATKGSTGGATKI